MPKVGCVQEASGSKGIRFSVWCSNAEVFDFSIDSHILSRAFIFSQIAFVAPDTSPRGANVEGEAESWDFGTGAGFYLDATSPKWAAHYRMYSYITKELPALLSTNFPRLDSTRYKTEASKRYLFLVQYCVSSLHLHVCTVYFRTLLNKQS